MKGPFLNVNTQVKVSKKVERKIVIFFLICLFMHVLGAQKNRLIETVLLSSQNLFFGRKIR